MSLFARIPSPCVGACRLNQVTQACDGCSRTLDEIARWTQLDADTRKRITAALPARRAALGVDRDQHDPSVGDAT